MKIFVFSSYKVTYGVCNFHLPRYKAFARDVRWLPEGSNSWNALALSDMFEL